MNVQNWAEFRVYVMIKYGSRCIAKLLELSIVMFISRRPMDTFFSVIYAANDDAERSGLWRELSELQSCMPSIP